MRNQILLCVVCLAASWAVAAPATAGSLPWSPLFEAASGPPYPTGSRVEFSVGEAFLPAVQRSLIKIGLDNVLADGQVAAAGLLGGNNGALASLDFSVADPAESNLAVDLLIEAFGDGSVRQGAVMQDFHFNTASFDLAFDILLDDGIVHRHAWRGDIASAQPFGFESASAAVLGDGSVRLLLGMNRLPGNQILAAPVIEMSMSADLVPEPVTALLLTLGGLVVLRRRPVN